jgi:hypothetical protein
VQILGEGQRLKLIMQTSETKAVNLLRSYFHGLRDKEVDKVVNCFHESYTVVVKAHAYGPNNPKEDQLVAKGVADIRQQHEDLFSQQDSIQRLVDVYKASWGSENETLVYVRYTDQASGAFEVTYTILNDSQQFAKREVVSIAENANQRKASIAA